ncbi:hypothetical protein N7512_001855 [Penicillium capsulatum]|nr:hypothetical protein N7512_001855 [Penicillium capsulatum]
MLQTVVSNNKDAMNLLFEAALREESQQAPAPERPLPGPARHSTDALSIWNACRFVKMGWFSAHEAVTLVDLFFAHLHPLSPILTEFFALHENHFYLVTQEPFLCCTILMVSSRYHTLPGVGGCSRAFFIHHRLWQHCQHLLLRVALGQEKISKAKTRNIGSIEALLLMSEWHPRSLQYPPETDGWDSDYIMTNLDARDPPPPEELPVPTRWREDVVEPTKRFEHMAWMVLNSALALAHELGAFDPNPRIPKVDDLVGIDAEWYLQHLEIRRQRLPSLLFVLMNALSSRMGCTSPMPSDVQVSMPGSSFFLQQSSGAEWVLFMRLWIELTKMTTTIVDTLLARITSAMTRGSADTFMSLVEEKQILLVEWRQRHLVAVPGIASDILFIEYQHLRILVNSIGMQCVVQTVLSHNPQDPESVVDHSFMEKAQQINLTGREYGFIEEVIGGCCQTLERITVLGATGSLHYSPMRVLFHTISASIFLIKALALGVRNAKLHEALQILDRAIAAMKDSNQDDVHLKTQYAALLQSHAARLRSSLVQSTQGYSKSHTSEPGRECQASRPESLAGEDVTNAPIFDLDVNDWLSLPFDPSMAPFGPEEGDAGARLAGVDLDLDFLWQLPP